MASSITHRRVLNVAVPIVISNATIPLLGAVDTAVVGQLGLAAPIGAVGIGAVVLTTIYWTFGFLRMGTTGLTAQAVSSTRLSLTWTDGSSAETGFGIWRQAGGVWTRIGVAAPDATTFSDTTTTAGTAYTYRLRAHNSTGASAWSNEAVVTTSGSP